MKKLQRFSKLLVCFFLMSTFFGCAATQKHESTGQYLDDSVITTRVKAAIFDESTLKSLQITVETFRGIVILSGFVDSAHSSTKAAEVAKHVSGVADVKNALIVK
jgi:osmotically-inducible protein OsmY